MGPLLPGGFTACPVAVKRTVTGSGHTAAHPEPGAPGAGPGCSRTPSREAVY